MEGRESSVAPPVQSTSRMSRSMREDLGIASPPPVKAAKKELDELRAIVEGELGARLATFG